jgi:hypothetical protein
MPVTEIPKGVLWPRCAYCGQDPLKFKRVRYDFPDGVLVETFFCSRCRRIISAQIVGLERPKKST